MIHPTAIIHAQAKVHPSCEIGPYTVIDAEVEIAASCVLGPQVYITGRTSLGKSNRVFSGCVLGEAPQDLKYSGEPTELRIGEGNIFRENVTVHRSSKAGEATIIGSNNYLMANAHVGHNCQLGDSVILANNVALGGYVQVDDRAFLSGNCMVHQFCSVGTMAMMQGSTAISQDLPPFCIARRINELCGLNIVGLRRAGMSSGERLELKRLYHALFRSGKNLRAALAEAKPSFPSRSAQRLIEFVEKTKRGVCRELQSSPVDDEAGQSEVTAP